ncbi:hypothetical protein [Nitrobacter sp. JJSN]|uniref:hypothetical protein n=1 Tax=Nitrobacter sp. JJSN TaxID=3453033 RepID=UPI003F76F21C
MANPLTKLEVARQQLGTATELFIRDRDPVSVQCLACGGAELIEAIAGLNNVEPLSTHMLETVPDMDTKRLRNIQRQYWNAFKHMTDFGGQPRDDTETLAAFNDTRNDAALFVGWWDYQAVTKRLPLPVQVFQVWWYALNEKSLAEGADLAAIRETFPNITAAGRDEQKRRLRRTIEKYRDNKEILADPRTEVGPLCISAKSRT